MYNLSVKSSTQFSVTLEHVPGAVAKIAEAFAGAGVSVLGFSVMSETAGQANFVVDQAETARKTLTAAGVSFTEDEVLMVVCPQDKAGILAAFARALADAGINIEELYYSSAGAMSETVVYLQTSKDSSAKAAAILKKL